MFYQENWKARVFVKATHDWTYITKFSMSRFAALINKFPFWPNRALTHNDLEGLCWEPVKHSLVVNVFYSFWVFSFMVFTKSFHSNSKCLKSDPIQKYRSTNQNLQTLRAQVTFTSIPEPWESWETNFHVSFDSITSYSLVNNREFGLQYHFH